jgi:hypothetical protein
MSGVDPQSAATLSANDGHGRSLALKLEQVADHVQVAPDALMQWIVEHDTGWVSNFTRSISGIRVNEDGSLQEKDLPADYGHYGANLQPRSLQGLLRYETELRDWAEQNNKR